MLPRLPIAGQTNTRSIPRNMASLHLTTADTNGGPAGHSAQRGLAKWLMVGISTTANSYAGR